MRNFRRQDCSGSRKRFTRDILCVGASRALCRIYILLCARARKVVRGRNCFPITTGHRRFPGMPDRRAVAKSRKQPSERFCCPLRAPAPIYRHYTHPSSPIFFPFNLPLSSVPLSRYFEIMTLVDTPDYRRGIRPQMTRLLRCIENELKGPIVHQILPIARNREGESEDRSDTLRSSAVSLAIAVSGCSGFLSGKNFQRDKYIHTWFKNFLVPFFYETFIKLSLSFKKTIRSFKNNYNFLKFNKQAVLHMYV